MLRERDGSLVLSVRDPRLTGVERATVGAIAKQDPAPPHEDRFAEAFERHWNEREGAGRLLVWVMLAPIAALLLFVVLRLAYSVIAAAVAGGGGM